MVNYDRILQSHGQIMSNMSNVGGKLGVQKLPPSNRTISHVFNIARTSCAASSAFLGSSAMMSRQLTSPSSRKPRKKKNNGPQR